jgi:hypothetical protein
MRGRTRFSQTWTTCPSRRPAERNLEAANWPLTACIIYICSDRRPIHEEARLRSRSHPLQRPLVAAAFLAAAAALPAANPITRTLEASPSDSYTLTLIQGSLPGGRQTPVGSAAVSLGPKSSANLSGKDQQVLLPPSDVAFKASFRPDASGQCDLDFKVTRRGDPKWWATFHVSARSASSVTATPTGSDGDDPWRPADGDSHYTKADRKRSGPLTLVLRSPVGSLDTLLELQ